MKNKPFNPMRKDISWRRTIHNDVKIMLAVKTAGRCEFRRCNKFLFRHAVTGIAGNFAELAHIIAFSPDGPRGRAARRPRKINGFENIMLLCQPCHKLIDDNPGLFPVSRLREDKRLHEERIRRLTDSKRTNLTSVVKLVTRVRGQDVDIPPPDIDEALLPRFNEERPCMIDLRSNGDLTPGVSMEAAARAVTENMGRFYGTGSSEDRVGHVSVFALAPIPLLVHLGSQLSNKVTTEFFQRHRDTDSWKWKGGGGSLRFLTSRRKVGSDPAKVALIVSVSGSIHLSDLPDHVRAGGYSVYEIKACPQTPRPDLLKTRADLERFRAAYQAFQGRLTEEHGGKAKAMDLFAAVPVPIALMLGYGRLPEVAPRLRVYENTPHDGGFKNALEVK